MRKRLRGIGVAIWMAASLASGQTSGSLDAQQGGAWTAQPWMITSGPGPFPTDGGVATLLPQINTDLFQFPPSQTFLTVDVAITLSGINFQGPFGWRIQSGGPGSLSLSASGATLSAELPDDQRFLIASPMSGGGAVGLAKIGAGTLTLSAANTYTGGTHINAGVIEASGGDTRLGASGAGNDISFDGGVLRLSGSSFTTSRAISVGPGDGGIDSLISGTPPIFNGVVSGSGDFVITGTTGTTFTADNTLNGPFIFAPTNGQLRLQGANGAFRFATAYDFVARGGVVILDNASANNNNRLNDSAPITMSGFCLLALTGNSGVSTTEVAGPLNVVATTRLQSVAASGQQTIFSFASINRQNKAPLEISGTQLDAPPGPFVAQITSAAAPGSLIGGGGSAGSANISVLPWATGKNTTSTFNPSFFHVTYDPVSDRLRALSSGEYAVFGGAAANNVRLTSPTVAPVNTTVNALCFAPPGPGNTLSGGPINVTSGSFIHAPTQFFSSGGFSTISAGLNFGTAEGIIHATQNVEISGTITGTGGLTISPRGSTVRLSGANTYTGQTHIYEGAVEYTNDGAGGSFGNSMAVNLYPGALVRAEGASLVQEIREQDKAAPALVEPLLLFIHFGSGEAEANPAEVERARRIALLTVIDPGAALRLTGGDTHQNATEVDGNISTQGGSASASSPPGRVTGSLWEESDRASGLASRSLSQPMGAGPRPSMIIIGTNSYVALNGNNAQEATEIAGHLILGSDTACGTGPVSFAQNSASIEGGGTTPRTLANPIELLATATFAGDAPLTFGGPITLNGARNVSVTSTQPATFNGNVRDGALTKQGAGTLVLNRSDGNDYAGGTSITAGTLLVNNATGSGTGAGTNLVNTGGTLAGNFSVTGATENRGTVKPGSSVGIASFGSTLFCTESAQHELELASAASADRINVAGQLTIDGTVRVIALGGYVAQLGQSFDLFDWGSLQAFGFTPGDLDLRAASAPGTAWGRSQFSIDGTITVAVDGDGDGLTDNDESTLFGSDPARADSDGDGMNDAAELRAGTDPNDGASVLRITDFSRNSPTSFSVTWQAKFGKFYRLLRSASLDFATATVVASNIPGEEPSTIFTDSTVPAGSAQLFYRVEVQ